MRLEPYISMTNIPAKGLNELFNLILKKKLFLSKSDPNSKNIVNLPKNYFPNRMTLYLIFIIHPFYLRIILYNCTFLNKIFALMIEYLSKITKEKKFLRNGSNTAKCFFNFFLNPPKLLIPTKLKFPLLNIFYQIGDVRFEHSAF